MERSSFFNEIFYLAEDFARYFNSFIGNGVFPNPSTGLQVVSVDSNMDIRIRQGKGWINGYFYENTDDRIFKIDIADGVLSRIDRVVLRLNFLNGEIKAHVKKGAYSSPPIAPTLIRNADMYELGIADIRVSKGIIKITQADITDLRFNTSLCGIVKGVVDQIDTTNLFAQYQSQFDIWFKDVQTQLGEDVAGSLQNQITQDKNNLENFINSKGKPGGLAELGVDGNLKVDVGEVKQFATEPWSNWLRCDGTSLLKSEYPQLYDFLGSKYETPIIRDFIERPTKLPNYQYVNKVVFGNNIYVGAADGGKVLTSPDGINWTVRQTNVTSKLGSIAFGNGIFVTHSSGSLPRKSLVSTDGITWAPTDETIFGTSVDVTDIIFDGTQFIALVLEGTNTKVFSSANGIDWEFKYSGYPAYRNLCFGNGVYAMMNTLSSDTQTVAYSKDLKTWLTTNIEYRVNNGIRFDFINGLFVVSNTQGNVFISTDCIRFSKIDIKGATITGNIVFLSIEDEILLFSGGDIYTIPSLSSVISPQLNKVRLTFSPDIKPYYNKGLIIAFYASAPQVVKTSMYYDPLKFSLPIISNSYIKAKEV